MTKKEKDRVQEVLFPQSRGMRTDFAEISRRTGISATTLRRYKREPETIPCGRLLLIVEAMGTSHDDCGYMLTGRKK